MHNLEIVTILHREEAVSVLSPSMPVTIVVGVPKDDDGVSKRGVDGRGGFWWGLVVR